MKEIKAYVRTDRTAKVLESLLEAGIRHILVDHVTLAGPMVDKSACKMSIELGCKTQQLAKLEVICLDRDELRAVDLIRKAAATGKPGDGLVLVHNINRIVNIHTGSESAEAV